MQLSDAIRLGAMLKPQGYGRLIRFGHTCAIGAALDACGELPDEDQEHDPAYQRARVLWPILRADAASPIDGLKRPLFYVVWDLNDFSHWTREEIAAFVATVEPVPDDLSVLPQQVTR